MASSFTGKRAGPGDELPVVPAVVFEAAVKGALPEGARWGVTRPSWVELRLPGDWRGKGGFKDVRRGGEGGLMSLRDEA